MAIASVQAYLNGTWYSLTYNSGTGKYEATLTAPGGTSYNQPNNVYAMQVKATNTAGKASTVTINGTLDTSVPVISSVSIVPNPVDAGATMIISVEVIG